MGRFQYTGQAFVSELNLYYYKARFYSPELKRFLQPDPIGYAGGMNLYGYVGGDPVNHTDPTGTIITAIPAGVMEAVRKIMQKNDRECTGSRIKGGCGGLMVRSEIGPAGGSSPRVFRTTVCTNDGSGDVCSSSSYVKYDRAYDRSVSSAQWRFLRDGDFRSFYWSRILTSHDEYAAFALSVVDSTSFFGAAARDRVEFMWLMVNGVFPSQKDMSALSLSLARAYANAVARDVSGTPNLLSPAQHGAYHFSVFQQFGLPTGTFGGAPITGTQWEIGTLNDVMGWCSGCDTVPCH